MTVVFDLMGFAALNPSYGLFANASRSRRMGWAQRNPSDPICFQI